jgi:hypothetical protein
MIYSKGTPGGGVWHCPFTPEWVEKMRRAAKHCELLSAEYIARCISNEEYIYQVPHGDFLSTPQDSRGVPIGYDNSYQNPISCEIYDYSSIPDVVVTNGREDWPLCVRRSVLMA